MRLRLFLFVFLIELGILFLALGIRKGISQSFDSSVGWVCEIEYYGSGDGCHCECGTLDPDCREEESVLVGCDSNDDFCNVHGYCDRWKEWPVPPEWTCSEANYGTQDGCDCECGAFDPDCYDPSQKLRGCRPNALSCSFQSSHCIYENEDMNFNQSTGSSLSRRNSVEKKEDRMETRDYFNIFKFFGIGPTWLQILYGVFGIIHMLFWCCGFCVCCYSCIRNVESICKEISVYVQCILWSGWITYFLCVIVPLFVTISYFLALVWPGTDFMLILLCINLCFLVVCCACVRGMNNESKKEDYEMKWYGKIIKKIRTAVKSRMKSFDDLSVLGKRSNSSNPEPSWIENISNNSDNNNNNNNTSGSYYVSPSESKNNNNDNNNNNNNMSLSRTDTPPPVILIPFEYNTAEWPRNVGYSGFSVRPSDFMGLYNVDSFLTGYSSYGSFRTYYLDNAVNEEITSKFSKYQYSSGDWKYKTSSSLDWIKREYNSSYDMSKVYEMVYGIFLQVGENIQTNIESKFDLISDRNVRNIVEEYVKKIMSEKFSNLTKYNDHVSKVLSALYNQRNYEIGEHVNAFGNEVLEEMTSLLQTAMAAGQWVPHFNDISEKLRQHLLQSELQDLFERMRFHRFNFYESMCNALMSELKNLFSSYSSNDDLNDRFRTIQQRFWETVSNRLREISMKEQMKKIKDEQIRELDEHIERFRKLLLRSYLKKMMYQAKYEISIGLGEVVDEMRMKYEEAQIVMEDWLDFPKKRIEVLDLGFKGFEKLIEDENNELHNPQEYPSRIDIFIKDFIIESNEEIEKITHKIQNRYNEKNKQIITKSSNHNKKEEEEEIEGEDDDDDDDDSDQGKKEEVIVPKLLLLPIIKMKPPMNSCESKFDFKNHVLDINRFKRCMLSYLDLLLKKVFQDYDNGLNDRYIQSRKNFLGVLNKVIPPLAKILQFDLICLEMMLKLQGNIHSWKQIMEISFDWNSFRENKKKYLQENLKKYCPPPPGLIISNMESLSEDEQEKQQKKMNAEINEIIEKFWVLVREEIGPIVTEFQIKEVKNNNIEILRRIIECYNDIEFVDWKGLLKNKEEELEQIIKKVFGSDSEQEQEGSGQLILGQLLMKFFQQVQAECELFKNINNKKREMEVNLHLKHLIADGFGSEEKEEGDGNGKQIGSGSLEIKLFYEVTRMLGEGAFGKVLEVKRKLDNKLFAMKLALFETKSKQRRQQVFEIVLLKKLRHDYIIRFEDVFFCDKFHYVVMEKGSMALDGFIKQQKPIDEDVIWKFFIQMCLGFNCLHKNGIVHQDVKPANVLLGNEDNNIKICDLGMSKQLEEDNRTSEGGTMLYMSPEHKSSFEDRSIRITEKIDCWAIGLIVYELCRCSRTKLLDNGKMYDHPAFEVMDYMNGIINDPISNYSDFLKRMIKNLLKVEPDERWNTFDVLKDKEIQIKAKEIGIEYEVKDVEYDPLICFSSEFHNRFGDDVFSLLRECFTEDELKIEFLVNHSHQKVEEEEEDIKIKKNKKTIYFIESTPKDKNSSICLFKRLLIVDILKLLHLTNFCSEIFVEGFDEYSVPEIFKDMENPNLSKSPLFRYALLKNLFIKTSINPIEFYSFVFGKNFKIFGGEDKKLFEIERGLFLRRKAQLLISKSMKDSITTTGDVKGDENDNNEENEEEKDDYDDDDPLKIIEEAARIGEKIEELFEQYGCANEDELKEILLKKRVESTFHILLNHISKKKEEKEEDDDDDSSSSKVFFYGSPIFGNEMKEHCEKNEINMIYIKPFPIVDIQQQKQEEKDINMLQLRRKEEKDKNKNVNVQDIIQQELASIIHWNKEFCEGKEYLEKGELRNSVKCFGNVLALQPFFLDNRQYFIRVVKEYEERRKKEDPYSKLRNLIILVKLLQVLGADVNDIVMLLAGLGDQTTVQENENESGIEIAVEENLGVNRDTEMREINKTVDASTINLSMNNKEVEIGVL